MRATYHVDSKEKNLVVIDALPYQVSGNKIQEQIAKLILDKKLPWVTDINDESDHENPCRIVLELRSTRVDVERVMSHLFASTDLESNYRVNLNMIGLNGKPQVKNLKDILSEWLLCRRDVVTRRLQYRLDKIDKRLHILAGLLIAYLNIDEVIRIIREEDDPKLELIQRYELTEIQANAILDIRLRQLAKLEEIELKREQGELEAERAIIQAQLDNPEQLTALIIEELNADMKEHGDDRMSPVVERDDAQALKESDLVPSEPITAILSKAGWIRAAKGHDIDAAAMSYRSGDSYQAHVAGKSNEKIYLLDSTGRSYSLEAHTLASARGQGDPLTSVLKPAAGARFEQLLAGDDTKRIVLASSQGYGFINTLGNLDTNQKAGKNIINFDDSASLLPVVTIQDAQAPNSADTEANTATNGNANDNTATPISGVDATSNAHDQVAVVTSAGYLLIFALDDLPEQARGKGNKLINLKKGETVVAITTLHHSDSLTITAGKRHVTLKPMDLANYTGSRANRGSQLPRGFQNVSSIEVAD